MPPGKPIPAMVVEEALASGDARFLEYLRSCRDPRGLARVVEKWKKDHRPWAREQVLRYLELPMDVPGHEVVVKRLFKNAVAKSDDEQVGAFLVAFDRLARRRRVRHVHYDWRTGDVDESFTLRSPHFNKLPQKRPDWWAGTLDENIAKRALRLFSYHTRYFLRRWAWRYFRRMGFSRPKTYPAAVAQALMRCAEPDLSEGQAILDSWGLMHICFGKSPNVRFTTRHANLLLSQPLDQMVAPYFEPLWQKADSAPILLELTIAAPARPIRMWAATLIRRHHLSNLTRIPVKQLLAVLDHTDPEVQTLGADLIEHAEGLENLDVATWLKLLSTRNVTAQAAIAQAMQKHVHPERLTLDQMVSLACARPAPVARLGLDMLKSRPINSDADRQAVARLASAQCEGLGKEIAAYALSILGTAETYHVDSAIRFFDSLHATMREGAWAWLAQSTVGWNDAALWSRLLETPYDDIRMKFIAALETRTQKSASGLPPQSAIGSRQSAIPSALSTPHSAFSFASLWCSVLLAIHRGGRTKLVALNQISQAIVNTPDQAATLLPVLAVAIRSVRVPEARRGLAAIVQLIERRPELMPQVKQHFPEMQIEEVPQ